MKRAFVDVKGILLIMKITNRQLTHANSLFLSASASVSCTQTDKVCLYFHFLIRTLLSQRELLLTSTQTLTGLYEFLH